MLNRIISSVMAATAFAVMAITPSNPGSLLFIFISGNKIIATVRLAIALVMVAISFELVRFNGQAKKPLLYAGLTFIGLGLISTIVSPILYSLYDYLKIMDLMIAMEFGILLCSTAMRPAPAKLQKARTKKSLKPRVALRQA